MRIIFMGSPRFAVPALDALVSAGCDVALVVSQPDRPAGRGRQVRPPAVAAVARELGLPLIQPESLKPAEAVDRLNQVRAELIVVAAYGLILPSTVLALVDQRAANVHPSLLPRNRGATPIQAALVAGDPETGVTIMQMVARMDAGPIIAQRTTPISPSDDTPSLEPRLAHMGAELLVEILEPWAQGRLQPIPQQESLATYCPRLTREAAELNWHEAATAIWRTVRAYRGWPDAYTFWDGRLLKVLGAEPLPEAPGGLPPGSTFAHHANFSTRWPAVVCGEGALLLRLVMMEGKRATPGDAFLRGYPRFVEAKLGG